MRIFYPDNLPISKHKDDIIASLRTHQVTIVAGDTGSGKTTQLPKMCLDAFPENKLLVGCTQPRRIATSTVAARVAEELGKAGAIVGYKIRFQDRTSPSTKIKFMTDGVLLAETRQDRLLSKYGVVIIDEAHERNLNIDFLLGYLNQLLDRRPDLKIIITSATIDTEAFAKHFNDAPIITVAGRSYPITLQYDPVAENFAERKDGVLEHCVESVCELFKKEVKGDILVFLPTERDIRECCQVLEDRIPQAVILPMFGRLGSSDQKRIFQNFKKIKVVVATNVAETSVTVPGIRYVIDSGLARISHYNTRAKTTSLPVSRISRASCDQRKGRCGRVGPGFCIRLYSEEDYDSRDEFTVPELQRSNLAEVILQMISLDLGHPDNFPFIDPPKKSAIREGYKLLRELGALHNGLKLTQRGRMMADMPIDPCISRIILEAKENNCLREIKIISAVLAIQDPRIRPADLEKEADQAHQVFNHPHSDFMVLLNIWNAFHNDTSGNRSWSKLKKFCKRHYLSFQRMREWFDLHEQLSWIISRRKGFQDNSTEPSYEQLHKSLLAGFLRNVARKKQGKMYQGAQNKELMIFPGSQQFSKGPGWLIAATFIETSRLYGLTVAAIEPEWLEPIAGPLCSYSWSNPNWSKKTGQVIAVESVSLFGLIIVSGRRVNFGQRSKKNIEEARNIFIEAALVRGELKSSYRFLSENLSRIEKWQGAEKKLRVKNIVADDIVIFDFYADRIPKEVYDQRTLNRFLKRKRSQSFLLMTDEDVLRRRPEVNELVDFPNHINIGGLEVRIEYHFEPGSENDGVTFRLPSSFASTISHHRFEWLVPGLLTEKLTFLLKGLPKSIRKRLIPIGDTVNRLLDNMDFGAGSLYSALEGSILKQFELLVPRAEWTNGLPPHLQARYVLFDDGGRELSSGRNLTDIISCRQTTENSAIQPVLKSDDQELVSYWKNSEHSTWNFNGLPAKIATYTPFDELAGYLYSALIVQPERGSVRIEFLKDREKAETLNRKAMLYLYRLQFADQYKGLKKMCSTVLSGPSSVALLHKGTTRKEVADEVLYFVLMSVFGPLPSPIVSENTFKNTVATVREKGLYQLGQKIIQDLMLLLRKRHSVQQTIVSYFTKDSRTRLGLPDKKTDFQDHLEEIFPADLLRSYQPIDLGDIGRGLQSLSIRLERFYANPEKDLRKAEQLSPYLTNLDELLERQDQLTGEAAQLVQRFRTMVNEYRISLFSPEIRTREVVSAKKLDQQWRATISQC